MTEIDDALAAARAAFDEGENERALDLCRQVLVREPANVRALGASARCLTALGRHDEAADTARAAVAGDPTQPWGHVALVVALYTAERNADVVSAVLAAESAELSAAQRAGLLSMAAYAAIAVDRLEDAEKLATRAIELGAGDASAHAALATAFGAQRKMGPALVQIDRALALDPNSASLKDRRAALMEGVEIAERSLKRASASNAEAPSAAGWREIAEILELLGRDAEAAHALREANELDKPRIHKVEKN